MVSKVSDEAVVGGTSYLEFEEEKLYISQSLKSLEKKLHQIYCNRIFSIMPNGRLENLANSKSNQRGYSDGEGPQLGGRIEQVDFLVQKSITFHLDT